MEHLANCVIKIPCVRSCSVAVLRACAHTHTHTQVSKMIHNFSLARPNMAALVIQVLTDD